MALRCKQAAHAIEMYSYSLTGMQVHHNPGIAVCERGTEGMNATEEFATEYGSRMMPNDTTGETNVTCVRCGM